MPFICAEVFPVTCVSSHPRLIRVLPASSCPALIIPTISNHHPNESVLEHLRTIFEECFDLAHTIVHSTSWRYEPQHDRLLLTYIAVLPHEAWLEQWIATKRITLEPIAGTTQQGDRLFPPTQIAWSAALAHALDHLAALNTYDSAIQKALDPAWYDILRQRIPHPAGCLQRYPSPVAALPSIRVGSAQSGASARNC